VKTPRLSPLAGEFGEQALDGIGPGAAGRGEVEGGASMPPEPGRHPRFRGGRLLGCLWVA
jgi:hypothetical protein